METSSSRILVVDNFEPWRRFVCSTLEKCERLQVVGEATDGVEAIEKAITLKPDLVLLDVVLPRLNGFEAAKRVRDAVPGVKLLFVTLILDDDFMTTALSTGANGCIVKRDAARELVPAISAILRGETFFSASSEKPSSVRKLRVLPKSKN